MATAVRNKISQKQQVAGTSKTLTIQVMDRFSSSIIKMHEVAGLKIFNQ
jgi:C4-type Zn-finger protein